MFWDSKDKGGPLLPSEEPTTDSGPITPPSANLYVGTTKLAWKFATQAGNVLLPLYTMISVLKSRPNLVDPQTTLDHLLAENFAIFPYVAGVFVFLELTSILSLECLRLRLLQYNVALQMEFSTFKSPIFWIISADAAFSIVVAFMDSSSLSSAASLALPFCSFLFLYYTLRQLTTVQLTDLSALPTMRDHKAAQALGTAISANRVVSVERALKVCAYWSKKAPKPKSANKMCCFRKSNVALEAPPPPPVVRIDYDSFLDRSDEYQLPEARCSVIWFFFPFFAALDFLQKECYCFFEEDKKPAVFLVSTLSLCSTLVQVLNFLITGR